MNCRRGDPISVGEEPPTGALRRAIVCWFRRCWSVSNLATVCLGPLVVAQAESPATRTSVEPSTLAARADMADMARPPNRHPAPAHATVVVGTLPADEQVGAPVELVITVQNRGACLQHLLLAFSGLDHWVVVDVRAVLMDPVELGDHVYDVGWLGTSDEQTVTFDLMPKDAGQQLLRFNIYHEFDPASGGFDPGSGVGDGTGRFAVTIHPRAASRGAV